VTKRHGASDEQLAQIWRNFPARIPRWEIRGFRFESGILQRRSLVLKSEGAVKDLLVALRIAFC
jgi:hypothetical protein